MELWIIDGPRPRKIAIDLEVDGDDIRDAEGRVVRQDTHFETEEEAWSRIREREAARGLRAREPIRT